MREPEPIHIDLSALIAWDMISDAQRQCILALLTPLVGTSPEQWPADQILRAHDPVYFKVQVPPDLWVFFQREENGDLTIVDLLRQGFFDQFSSKKEQAQAVP